MAMRRGSGCARIVSLAVLRARGESVFVQEIATVLAALQSRSTGEADPE